MLLIPENARIIGQGLTGSEGQSTLPGMVNYGTKIVAGVTPGKGGQTVMDVPIFNTVKEAISVVGKVDGSVQFVPPLFTKNAVIEALDAGIKFILIGAEKVPTKDAAEIFAYAKKKGANVIGPSSVGLISTHNRIKMGAIGGSTPERVFAKGNIAIISKSGGMASEIGLLLKNHGLGVSWAVGIGGDRIISTDFTDFLLELEKDPETKASVIFGELGGTYEEKVAELVKQGKIEKKVVAFIAGEFTKSLPGDVQFGHAGAIIEGSRGLPEEKRRVLKEAGVAVAGNFDDIPDLLK
ncbi:MAG: Succinyl-CoA synthetase (ADP-forming) alpha subunit [Candidatus Woesebacteria bacterium GW2011_GWB1_45_5]|uniref:Succinyl-CoA synthetase (ADP-forming) alpha subunit n=1 Tax=Candidatus Woesebacteria bacterium GW2011_GWB1_45_5 TaxID=1618581 RepID=A0A0G1MLY8_9BACT|nr:MAG: Succinyl-CoA synthetase (ADP-forming) alpha subunit [Candidatus Woesebacteria bacterium GW2011_GWB1_45_5]